MSFDLELALDRLDAELAAELPPHMVAFAEAHAAERPPPPAPAVLGRTFGVARAALRIPALARRGLALLRLVPKLDRETTHAINGAAIVEQAGDVPPDGRWTEPGGLSVEPDAVWRALSARHGARCDVRFVSSNARPRTFVVERHRCIAVVPWTIDSPSRRFALMHELGHVLAASLGGLGLPRALDEGVAAFIARDPDPRTVYAQRRRLALAKHLALVEAGVLPAPDPRPWALDHDPFAQASYVAAEAIADELDAANLAGSIARIHARIDAAAIALLV